MKRCLIAIISVLFCVLCVNAQEVTVHVNSGNPRFPFPQFLDYSWGDSHRLDNLGTRNPEGVVHAEMEQDIRDAYQIFANEWTYTGDAVGGVKYIRGNIGCPYDCREGDGYSLLAAALMGDKTSFDGLWMCVHDKARVKQPRYIDGVVFEPNYAYGDYALKDNDNSATDGDVDIALALYIAWMQWGDDMGVRDVSGNMISYRKEMIDVIRGLVAMSTRFPTENPQRNNTGEIGFDGYMKNGDTWNEITGWASQAANYYVEDGIQKYPEYGGPQQMHTDYLATGYFREFHDLLEKLDLDYSPAWEREQYRRAEASGDWMVGNWTGQNPKYIFMGETASISAANVVSLDAGNQGGRFRSAWRTALNYTWHGAPTYTWNPVTHKVESGTNEYELKASKQLSGYMNSPQDWGNIGCTEYGGGPDVSYKGPSTLNWEVMPNGISPVSTFTLNWVPGTGMASAINAQDLDLAGLLYRQCNIEWDVKTGGDGYLTSVPVYFHGFFRLLGMLIATGNHQAPSKMVPQPNMKIYRVVEDSVSCAYTGDVITYHLDYRNYGSVDAKDVKIVENVPDDFIFVSATNGGVYNAATHTVTWNIGTVPGFQTGGLDVTKGRVSYDVKIGPKASGRYCTTASISCSNGLGWTSNEYPNAVTPTMQRNCVDVIKRSLLIEKIANREQVNPENNVVYTINFENSSEVGWLDGGRPRVGIAVSNQISSNQLKLRFRLYNDAIEPYINYGNYRISYYLFDASYKCLNGDAGCANGWTWASDCYEGRRTSSDNITLSREDVVEGSDEYGRWNQRLMLKFAPLLVTSTGHISNYYGMGSRVHRGGAEPLRVFGRLTPNYKEFDATDDWSYNANITDADDGLYFPVSPSWQEIDPATGASVRKDLNEYIPSICETPRYTVPNILVEEFDGYTWRRILGTGPMAGRDAENVVIVDTLPKGLTFVAFQGNCPLASSGATWRTYKLTDGRDVVEWRIPMLKIKQKGSIVYSATAKFPSGASCQSDDEDIDNLAWIYADLNSPIADTATVTVTCAKVPEPIVPTTLSKTASVETAAVDDEVTFTLKYEQTHGAIFNETEKNASYWTQTAKGTISGGKATLAQPNNGEEAKLTCKASKSKNMFAQFDATLTQYAEVFFFVRDKITLKLKPEWDGINVECNDNGTSLGTFSIAYDNSKPFHFALDITDNILRLWFSNVSVDTSVSAQVTAEVRTLTSGCFGFYQTGSGNNSFSNIHVHTDYAYNLKIVDDFPSELEFVSATDGGTYTNGKVVWTKEQGMDNPIPFGTEYTVSVTARVKECSEKVINEAHVELLGHADDEIRAQAVLECGASCPGKPTVSSPVEYCQGETASALTATGTSLKWYTSATGGTAQSSITPSTTTVGTTTYYVSQTANDCEGPREAVDVIVYAKPDAPTVTASTPVCVGDEITLSVPEVEDATYAWSGPDGFTSTDREVSVTSSATEDNGGEYTAIVTSAKGCASDGGSATVVVNAIPDAPVVTTPIQYCKDEVVSDEVSATGTELHWYTSETGATEYTSLVPVTTTVGSAHYYVSQTVNGCESERADLEVKTLEPPTAPTITTNSPICAGGTIELSTDAEGTYEWTGPNSFTSTEQKPEINGAVAASAGEYSLVVKVGNCYSEAGTATVVVNSIPSTPSPTNNGPQCDGEEITLSVATVTDATYSWTGPNSFTSSEQKPKITASSATIGEYSLIVTVADCPSEAGTTVVEYYEIPEAPTVTTPLVYCKDEEVSDEVTATGSNLIWYTSETGTTKCSSLVPVTSTVGSVHYFVSQTVNGCESARANLEVQTLEPPTTPTVITNSPLCEGADLALEITSDGTYQWTGPNGFTSTDKNPVISSVSLAAAGEYSVIVKAGNCLSEPGKATVVVNPIPSISFDAISNQCIDGADVTLNATASPTGGTGIYTGDGVSGNTFSPSSVTVGGHEVLYTYEVNGCSKSESRIVVVQDKPEVSFTLPTTACKGGTVISLIGNQTGGTFTASPSVDLTSGFNPAAVTVGQEYTITYEYSDGVCSNSTSNGITVYDPAKPVGTNASSVYTKVPPIPALTATGVNQIWYSDESLTTQVGTGDSYTPNASVVVDGSQGKVGTYTYYVVSTEETCVSEKTPVTLEISSCEIEAPVPVNNLVDVCFGETDNAKKTLEVTAGSGNIRWYYEGTKVQDDEATTFIPTETAVGSYTYEVSLYDAAANCESPKSTITFKINDLPTVSFTPTAEVCAGSAEIDFSTSKSQSTGVVTDASHAVVSSFDPTTAGTYEFTYSYTDANACTNTTTASIEVNALPELVFTTVPDKCEYDAEFALTSFVSPAGGTFSGNGVSQSKNFNPAAVTPGSTTEIMYVYTDANGCSNSNTFNVTVNARPTITFNDVPSACIGGDEFDIVQYVSPKTGSFAGEHILGTNFNPEAAGSFSVDYTVEENGCTATVSKMVVVNKLPELTLNANDVECVNTGDINPLVSPAGGILKLDGSVITAIQTNSLSAGNYTLSYEYTNATTRCYNEISQALEIREIPTPTVEDKTVVISTGDMSLSVIGNGGAYTWTDEDGMLVGVGPTINHVYDTEIGSWNYCVVETDGVCKSEPACMTFSIINCPVPAPTVWVDEVFACTNEELPALSADGDYEIHWYKESDLSSYIAIGNSYKPNDVTTTGEYHYYVSQNDGTCEGEKVKLTLFMNSTPLPKITGNREICENENLLLNADCDALWYSEESSIYADHIGSTYNVSYPTAGTYSLYVTRQSEYCTSNPITVTITVNAIPDAPAILVEDVCKGADVVFTAEGEDIQWIKYGMLVGDGNQYVESDLLPGSMTVNATQTVNGCVSPEGEATVNIFDIPSAPIALNQAICNYEDIVEVGVQVQSDAEATWYSDEDLNFQISTGSTYTPTKKETQQFYVTQTENNCESEPAVVTFTVNQRPGLVTFKQTNDVEVCEGNNAVIVAESANTIYWYENPAGKPIFTGRYFTTPTSEVGEYVYYASQTDAAGCVSEKSSKKVVIVAGPTMPTLIKQDTICEYDEPGRLIVARQSDNETLSWISPTGATLSLGDTLDIPKGLITKSGVYNFKARTTVATCSYETRKELTVKYVVHAKPAKPTLIQTAFCFDGSPVTLETKAKNVVWYNESGIVAGVNSQTYATPYSAVGNYNVLMTQTINNCTSDKAKLPFLISAIPTPSITGADGVCAGANEVYVVTKSDDANTIKWKVTGNRVVYDMSIYSSGFVRSIDWTNVGFDTIFVEETNKYGCIGKKELPVEVIDKPDANFVAETLGQEGVVTFTNLSECQIVNNDDYEKEYHVDYFWDFGRNTDTALVLENKKVFEQRYKYGNYTAELTAINEFGCKTSVTQPFFVDVEHGLFVPTAFAPFNPAEDVRIFKPKGFNCRTFEIWIYDAWNNLVYYSEGVNESGCPLAEWDGTVNGKVMQSGVYRWKINVTFEDSEDDNLRKVQTVEPRYGNVMLVR